MGSTPVGMQSADEIFWSQDIKGTGRGKLEFANVNLEELKITVQDSLQLLRSKHSR